MSPGPDNHVADLAAGVGYVTGENLPGFLLGIEPTHNPEKEAA